MYFIPSVCLSVFTVLETEPRSPCVPGKGFTAELQYQPFKTPSLQSVGQGLPEGPKAGLELTMHPRQPLHVRLCCLSLLSSCDHRPRPPSAAQSSSPQPASPPQVPDHLTTPWPFSPSPSCGSLGKRNQFSKATNHLTRSSDPRPFPASHPSGDKSTDLRHHLSISPSQ